MLMALAMQVKNAAIKALTSASAAMGNKDIEKLVPAVISAMANPSQVWFSVRFVLCLTVMSDLTQILAYFDYRCF